MSEILLRDDTGAVARLTLNRPEALNALSEEMMADLQTELDRISVDPSIRVVTLAVQDGRFAQAMT